MVFFCFWELAASSFCCQSKLSIDQIESLHVTILVNWPYVWLLQCKNNIVIIKVWNNNAVVRTKGFNSHLLTSIKVSHPFLWTFILSTQINSKKENNIALLTKCGLCSFPWPPLDSYSYRTHGQNLTQSHEQL